MRIRSAISADAAELARVQLAAWRAAYAGILPARFLERMSQEKREQGWRAILLEGKTITLVLDREGDMLGFINVGAARDTDKQPGRTGEVHALYLLPGQWGRGHGRRLLEAGVEVLARGGYSEVVLWVLQENRRARWFYERQGFRWDGEVKVERVGDTEPQQLRYTRTLEE